MTSENSSVTSGLSKGSNRSSRSTRSRRSRKKNNNNNKPHSNKNNFNKTVFLRADLSNVLPEKFCERNLRFVAISLGDIAGKLTQDDPDRNIKGPIKFKDRWFERQILRRSIGSIGNLFRAYGSGYDVAESIEYLYPKDNSNPRTLPYVELSQASDKQVATRREVFNIPGLKKRLAELYTSEQTEMHVEISFIGEAQYFLLQGVEFSTRLTNEANVATLLGGREDVSIGDLVSLISKAAEKNARADVADAPNFETPKKPPPVETVDTKAGGEAVVTPITVETVEEEDCVSNSPNVQSVQSSETSDSPKVQSVQSSETSQFGRRSSEHGDGSFGTGDDQQGRHGSSTDHRKPDPDGSSEASSSTSTTRPKSNRTSTGSRKTTKRVSLLTKQTVSSGGHGGDDDSDNGSDDDDDQSGNNGRNGDSPDGQGDFGTSGGDPSSNGDRNRNDYSNGRNRGNRRTASRRGTHNGHGNSNGNGNGNGAHGGSDPTWNSYGGRDQFNTNFFGQELVSGHSWQMFYYDPGDPDSIDPDTGNLFPWTAQYPHRGPVTCFPVDLGDQHRRCDAFCKHFLYSPRKEYDSKYISRIKGTFPALRRDGDLLFFLFELATFGKANLFFIPPIHTLTTDDKWGSYYDHLPGFIKSHIEFFGYELAGLLRQERVGLVTDDRYASIVDSGQDGYAILLQLATLTGAPALSTMPVPFTMPRQKADCSLVDHVKVVKLAFLRGSLQGHHPSDRFWLESFLNSIFPGYRPYCVSHIWNDTRQDFSQPIPNQFQPNQLAAFFLQHFTTIGKANWATKEPRELFSREQLYRSISEVTVGDDDALEFTIAALSGSRRCFCCGGDDHVFRDCVLKALIDKVGGATATRVLTAASSRLSGGGKRPADDKAKAVHEVQKDSDTSGGDDGITGADPLGDETVDKLIARIEEEAPMPSKE